MICGDQSRSSVPVWPAEKWSSVGSHSPPLFPLRPGGPAWTDSRTLHLRQSWVVQDPDSSNSHYGHTSSGHTWHLVVEGSMLGKLE
ncbi:hypothetical protein DPMN_114982 [Dreissena polymorpha]|uniref:Uncharacterized protein n=1 Tax=Dreissena polymorpha TaxID=45954 RepID=A0A9D4QSZ4_DREPO|nr:hypothetical protein DPMN_114982 [Dreissena polymorpha]